MNLRRRHALLLTAVLACLPALAAPAAASASSGVTTRPGGQIQHHPDGCAPHVAGAPRALPAPTRTTAEDRRLFMVGDSITDHSKTIQARQLTAHGWNGVVDGVGGRWLQNGITTLVEEGRSRRGLPQTVVIALGTNGTGCSTAARTALVEQLLTLLGPQRQVYWVNVYYRSSIRAPYTRFNRILTAAAARHPNLHLIDYAAWTAPRPWMLRDGVHNTARGMNARATLVTRALDPARTWRP